MARGKSFVTAWELLFKKMLCGSTATSIFVTLALFAHHFLLMRIKRFVRTYVRTYVCRNQLSKMVRARINKSSRGSYIFVFGLFLMRKNKRARHALLFFSMLSLLFLHHTNSQEMVFAMMQRKKKVCQMHQHRKARERKVG